MRERGKSMRQLKGTQKHECATIRMQIKDKDADRPLPTHTCMLAFSNSSSMYAFVQPSQIARMQKEERDNLTQVDH